MPAFLIKKQPNDKTIIAKYKMTTAIAKMSIDKIAIQKMTDASIFNKKTAK
jgi:hypothetical protein